MKTHCVSAIFVILFSAMLPQLAEADTGSWYGAVVLGRTRYDIATNVATGTFHEPGGITEQFSTSNGSSSHTYAIGYQFDRYISVEGAYANLGSATISSKTVLLVTTGSVTLPITDATYLDYPVTGYTVDAIGSLPLNDSVTLFAKAGLFRFHVQPTSTCSGCVSPAVVPLSPMPTDAAATTQDYGAGIGVTLSERFSVRLGYTLFHNVGDPHITGQTNIHLNYLQLLVDF